MDFYLTPCTKINSKWINNVYIRAKAIRDLEENIEVNLHNFGFGNGFVDMILKAQATKRKRKIIFHQNQELFCTKMHY